MNQELKIRLTEFFAGNGWVTVLTGAGISAASGIPTFRGPEGYWTVGSKAYHPQEMATYRMFTITPQEVWRWYLYRLEKCRRAEPNPAHLALVEMEARLKERFTLITQNVDGLHLRAGNTLERTFQIHGNVFYMRCLRNCTSHIYPVPDRLHGRTKADALTDSDLHLLKCPECGGLTRPHVLWFDEMYDEEHYRFASSLNVARRTGLLIIVATSGVTNLPHQVAATVKERGGIIVDINIEDNPFSELAQSSTGGCHLKMKAGEALAAILQWL